MSLDADTQLRTAPSARVLRAGQLRRQASCKLPTSSSGTVVLANSCEQSPRNCAAPSLIQEWQRQLRAVVSTLGRSGAADKRLSLKPAGDKC